ADPRWGSDGSLVWRSGHDWFRWNAGDGVVVHAAAPKAEDDPARSPKADRMREDQLRLVATLRREREQREALRAQEEQWRRADPSRPPAPVYLGKDVEIVATALSPDGRWLFAVTERKQDERGQPGRMPVYLTESGYEDTEEVRTRVGRNLPRAQSFWIVDLQQGTPREVSTAQLPGIGEDPLAALRREAGAEPLKGPRAVRIEAGVRGLLWSADSQRLALMLHSVDNKDRWLAVLDPGSTTLHSRHRLHDPAWINWAFNEFGWMPDQRTLWFVSEESGHAHLYTVDAVRGGRARALTTGRWEVSQPVLAPTGDRFLFTCNRARPGTYELCAVPAGGGEVRELTRLGRHGAAPLLQLRAAAAGGDGRRRRQPAHPHRHPHRGIPRVRLAATRIRAGAVETWRRDHLGQVLRAQDARARAPLPGGAVRARRGLPAERQRALPELLPRADAPQPAGAARLPRARPRLPRLGRLRPRLAHGDLPADGPSRARGLPRRHRLAGRAPPGRPRARGHLRRQLRRLHDLHGAVPQARHVQGRRRAASGHRLVAVQPQLHGEHPQHA